MGVQVREGMGPVTVKATATVKWPTVDEAKAELAKAHENLARAESMAPLQAMTEEQLRHDLWMYENQLAYAQKRIDAAKAELARRGK